jgi:hypothetical protein
MYLKDAAAGKGLPVSFTKLEGWKMAPIHSIDGLDREIDAVIATEIHQRKNEVHWRRHRVGGAGVAQTSKARAGGVTYNEFGRIVSGGDRGNAMSLDSRGNSRDSDERSFEGHEMTGQMDSRPDKRYSVGVGKGHDPYSRTSDTRTVDSFKSLSDPDNLQEAIEKQAAAMAHEKYEAVYSQKTVRDKKKMEPEPDNAD